MTTERIQIVPAIIFFALAILLARCSDSIVTGTEDLLTTEEYSGDDVDAGSFISPFLTVVPSDNPIIIDGDGLLFEDELTESLTIANGGSGVLKITSVSLMYDPKNPTLESILGQPISLQVESEGEQRIVSIEEPLELAGSTTAQIKLTYRRIDGYDRNASILIESDDTSHPSLSIDVDVLHDSFSNDTVEVNPGNTGAYYEVPASTPHTIDFGSVTPGTIESHWAKIITTGSTAVTVRGALVLEDYEERIDINLHASKSTGPVASLTVEQGEEVFVQADYASPIETTEPAPLYPIPDAYTATIVLLVNSHEGYVLVPVKAIPTKYCPVAGMKFMAGNDIYPLIVNTQILISYLNSSSPLNKEINGFYWWIDEQPDGSTAELTDAFGPSTKFTASSPGKYILGLYVVDSRGVESCTPDLATLFFSESEAGPYNLVVSMTGFQDYEGVDILYVVRNADGVLAKGSTIVKDGEFVIEMNDILVEGEEHGVIILADGDGNGACTPNNPTEIDHLWVIDVPYTGGPAYHDMLMALDLADIGSGTIYNSQDATCDNF